MSAAFHRTRIHLHPLMQRRRERRGREKREREREVKRVEWWYSCEEGDGGGKKTKKKPRLAVISCRWSVVLPRCGSKVVREWV